MHSFIQSLQNPNPINNFGYLNLQAKIKLHCIALLLFVGDKWARFASALCRQAALALWA